MKKLVVVLGICAVLSAAASAGLIPTLGQAGGYAILGLDETTITLNKIAANVSGNIGVAAGGTMEFRKGSVYGDIYIDSAATVNPWPFPSTNTTHVGHVWFNQDLSQAVTDAVAGSQAASALTATQTFGTITNSRTITGQGTGAVNVIDISSLALGNNQVLTLAGNANDVFILNVLSGGTLSLGNANSKIIGSGVDASQILINVLGETGTLKGEINGTILAVGKDINLQGALNGAVIAGSIVIGNEIALEIESTVHGVAFVPEPATMALLGLGGLLLRRRK